jgi:protein translocase SecG subunit
MVPEKLSLPHQMIVFMLIVSILLIGVILLQQKNSSLGAMAGQDAGEEMAQTRRGAEKFLHQMTIALAILFAVGGIYAMLFL